jgi:hypothetical protein
MDDKLMLFIAEALADLISQVSIIHNLTGRTSHKLSLGIASEDFVKDIQEGIFFACRHVTILFSTKILTVQKNCKHLNTTIISLKLYFVLGRFRMLFHRFCRNPQKDA